MEVFSRPHCLVFFVPDISISILSLTVPLTEDWRIREYPPRIVADSEVIVPLQTCMCISSSKKNCLTRQSWEPKLITNALQSQQSVLICLAILPPHMRHWFEDWMIHPQTATWGWRFVFALDVYSPDFAIKHTLLIELLHQRTQVGGMCRPLPGKLLGN